MKPLILMISKSRYFILFIALLIVSAHSAFAQQAQDPMTIPQLKNGVQLDITKISYANGKMTADIKVTNNSPSAYYNSYYTYQLQTPPRQIKTNLNGKFVLGQTDGDVLALGHSDRFDLPIGSTQNFTITEPVSPHMAVKAAILSIRILGQSETTLTFQKAKVPVQGDGEWVDMVPESCKITVGNNTFLAEDGPIIANPKDAYFFCDFTNKSQSQLSLKYKIIYAERYVNGNTEIITQDPTQEDITLSGGETKQLLFSVPEVSKPQVYEAYIILVDAQGINRSPYAAFRWTVPGPSAHIYNVTLDKPSYKKGETAQVSANADPSMDLWWRTFAKEVGGTSTESGKIGTNLNNATIVVRLTDSQNNLCGEQTLPLPKTTNKSWEVQKINVPMIRDCDNVKADVSIKNDDQTLSSTQLFMGTQPIKKSPSSKRNTLIAIAIVILLAVAAGGAFWWWKKKRNNKENKKEENVQVPIGKEQKEDSQILKSIALIISAGLVGAVFFTALATQNIVFADIELQPINTPINTPNVKVSNEDWFNVWANVSDFSTATQSGQSTVTVSEDCSKITIKTVGYSSGGICDNAKGGMILQTYLDGSPVSISSVLTTDEDGNTQYTPYQGGNSYMVMGRQEGSRNADFIINNPNPAQDVHKLQIRVGAAGQHGNIWTSFQQGYGGCDDSKQPCYIVMNKEFSCKPKYACNQSCTTKADCAGTWDGCTECRDAPNGSGGKTCQAPPPQVQCGAACQNDKSCEGARNGCTSCLPSLTDPTQMTCQPPASCGSECSTPASCQGAKDGCTSCIKESTGSGSTAKCGTCPAGMVYDPTQMKCACPNPNETNPHGVCNGDKCTQVNTCGVTECTTDKQCFSDEMCKCDGFEATKLQYPSADPFQFVAYAKVMGTDIRRAIVEGIQIKISESDKSNPNQGTIIVQSPMYTPELVTSTAQLMRYKATWNLTPFQIKPNKIYRAFSDIKCKPKQTARADASNPNNYQSKVAGVSTVNAADIVDTVSDSSNTQQLKTINFIKKGNTDNCRFLFFEYDSGS